MYRQGWVWLLGIALMACLSQWAVAAGDTTASSSGESASAQAVDVGGETRSQAVQPLRALRWGALVAPTAPRHSSLQAAGWWRTHNPRAGLRADGREGLGVRIVEVAPVSDPARPFQRPTRALEFPAIATTARAQEWGAPLRDCVHRLRLPSRISDAGALSVQAQWHLRCNF